MTDLTHYTLLCDGRIVQANDEFDTEPGPCIMGMKVWARDAEQAAEMIADIGPRLGFHPDGELQVFVTDPEAPMKDEPFGYDVHFTSYTDEEAEADASLDDDCPTIH